MRKVHFNDWRSQIQTVWIYLLIKKRLLTSKYLLKCNHYGSACYLALSDDGISLEKLLNDDLLTLTGNLQVKQPQVYRTATLTSDFRFSCKNIFFWLIKSWLISSSFLLSSQTFFKSIPERTAFNVSLTFQSQMIDSPRCLSSCPLLTPTGPDLCRDSQVNLKTARKREMRLGKLDGYL